MAVNDIASGALVGTWTQEILLAGDAPVTTDAAPALADIAKYQLVAITATGVTPYVFATHTADKAFIAAQAATTGEQAPYFKTGCFNHAIVGWPAGTDLDTYAERKAFFGNRALSVGKVQV